MISFSAAGLIDRRFFYSQLAIYPGEIRAKVFYCDVGKPYQNGAIEVDHGLIRRALTGVNGRNRSFKNLTQNDVILMMDYINSYKRKLGEMEIEYSEAVKIVMLLLAQRVMLDLWLQ